LEKGYLMEKVSKVVNSEGKRCAGPRMGHQPVRFFISGVRDRLVLGSMVATEEGKKRDMDSHGKAGAGWALRKK